MKKFRIWPFALLAMLLVSSGVFGALLGKGLAETVNTVNTENFTEIEMALPTRLLDINGEVITEFASDEKREIISFNELPQQMVDAWIQRQGSLPRSHRCPYPYITRRRLHIDSADSRYTLLRPQRHELPEKAQGTMVGNPDGKTLHQKRDS